MPDREDPPALSYPVHKADKTIKAHFGIKGYPTLIVLDGERVRQTFAGAREVPEAPVFLKAFSSGAVTVTEALANRAAPAGQETTIAAWVAVKGASFKDAMYYLSDGKSELKVKPWLLREAMRSPVAKTGPRTMAEVVRKAVVLKGSVQWNADGPVFVVKKEIAR